MSKCVKMSGNRPAKTGDMTNIYQLAPHKVGHFAVYSAKEVLLKSKYTCFPHCAHVPVLLRASVFRG